MPRLKPSDRQKRIAAIESVLHKYRMLYGFDTHTSVANHLGLSRTWYCTKRKNPERWTIGEIDALIRLLHIPPDEMVAALYGKDG